MCTHMDACVYTCTCENECVHSHMLAHHPTSVIRTWMHILTLPPILAHHPAIRIRTSMCILTLPPILAHQTTIRIRTDVPYSHPSPNPDLRAELLSIFIWLEQGFMASLEVTSRSCAPNYHSNSDKCGNSKPSPPQIPDCHAIDF